MGRDMENKPTDWNSMAVDLAKLFWGEPNLALSDPFYLRWGKDGARVKKTLDIRGGVWFDREKRQGGGVLDLVQIECKLDKRDAVESAKGKNVFQIKKGNPKERDTVILIRSLAEAERSYIRQVLRITKWKIKGEGGAA